MAKKIALFLSVVLFSILSIFVKFGPLSAETPFVDDLAKTKTICRTLEDILAETGFENVLIEPDTKGRIVASYENRLYRSEVAALGKVLQTVSERNFEKRSIVIIIKQLDYPILAFEVEHDLLKKYFSHEIADQQLGQNLHFVNARTLDSDIRELRNAAVLNPSFRKFEIKLDPQIDSNLGNNDDDFKVRMNVDLAGSTLLFRGVSLMSSIRLPVINEIDIDSEPARLYTAILNHLFPIGKVAFFNNNFGYFSGERYGISSQVGHYFMNGDIALAARVDFTGFLAYDRNTWFFSNLNLLTYDFSGYWQFSKYGLRLGVLVGKFLRGDHGIRASIGRYMREFRLDMFAIATNEDRWGGLQFRIPLFPKKRFQPRRLWFNVPNTYRVEYDYQVTDFGKSFVIPNNFIEFRSDLTRNYLLNHLEELRTVIN